MHTQYTRQQFEIEKNICIHKQYMYMNYKDGKKIKNTSQSSLPFCQSDQKGKKRKRIRDKEMYELLCKEEQNKKNYISYIKNTCT